MRRSCSILPGLLALVIVVVLGGGGRAAADDFPRDLVSWAAYPANPVFTGTGSERGWDRKIRERGWILFENNVYHLWYTGYNDDRSPNRNLGYAVSLDGIDWIRHPSNPIVSSSWVEDVCVVKDDETYYMFAEGEHDVAHLLTSRNRLTWTEQGPLDIRKVDGSKIAPGPYGTPTVLVEDGTWYLFYERGDRGVWLAKSTDHKVWTHVQDDPVLTMGPDEYDRYAVAIDQVFKRDGVYYAYYHANSHNPWQKDWTTNIARSKDLTHWEKYAGNPLVRNDSSSSQLVATPSGLRLYTMHPEIRVFVPRRDDATAIRGARVFDGSKLLPPSTVIIEGDRIKAVGPEAAIPPGARIVEGAGSTLLPGLIDAHVHTFDEGQLRQAAAFGVTTVLDMFTSKDFAARMRQEQARGPVPGRADLFSAGTLATAPGGHGTEYGLEIPTLKDPSEAQAFVDARIAEGSDYLKVVYDDGRSIGRKSPTISRETLASLIQAGHARGKKVVVHVLDRESARTALAEGADGLVHLFIDEPIDESLIAQAKQSKAFVIPTLAVLEVINSRGGGASLLDDPGFKLMFTLEDARSLKLTFPLAVSRPPSAATIPARAAVALERAGVPVLAGTDAPNPGTVHGASLHRELELLVAAGFTPTSALTAATSRVADAFGLKDRGRVAPGARADLVLVEGDPTVDIRSSRRIVEVWKAGAAVDLPAYRATVRLANDTAARNAKAAEPAGSAAGMVSDFEGAKVTANFGAGWIPSTDQFIGGKSTASFQIESMGAHGSKGAMKVAGVIADRPQPRWAGAMFSPGPAPMTPANLGSKTAISFWARGDGKPASVLLFHQARGYQPSAKSFRPTKEWTRFRFELKEFDDCDGKGVLGLFVGGGIETGPFWFLVDDVKFE